MDELAVFAPAHNLARYGRADINQLIWTNHWTPNPPGVWGQDGNLYTKKPPGISFITAPLIGLGHGVPGLNSVQVGLLTNALANALAAGLLFVWLVDLGFSRPTAALTGLGYGLCTMAWVYARMFWESSLLGLALLVAVWSVYRAVYLARPRPGWPWLLVSGLAVAVGLALRFEAALAIGLIGLFLVANRSASQPARVGIHAGTDHVMPSVPPSLGVWRSIRPFVLFLAPSLVIGLGLLRFNLARYGSMAETGYTQEISFHAPWVGAWGLLFSPGNGLFIYAPLLLLFFFGLRPAWRRLPHLYFGLILGICLGYWLFYGAWFSWGGTWGWGPRFLVPILPLLMPFVAEPLEWLGRRRPNGKKGRLLWLGVGLLALLSLGINFLGVAVDFNEYFLLLDSNDNFVFNWAAFPPLAHWRILQEGLVDLIWLSPQVGGLQIEWAALLPALVLWVGATANLVITWRGQKDTPNRIPPPGNRIPYFVLALVIVISLTFLMMAGTARISIAGEQARYDLAVLDSLDAGGQPGDALLVAMPPFGDAQEITTLLIAYLEPAMPTYAWIESGPRAIQPEERARMWRAAQDEARRVWLFERWLTPSDPTGATAAHLNQEAFPIEERWFAQSGRLTLYALADQVQHTPPTTSLNVPFQGGLVLADFAVLNDQPVKAGDVLKLRLTWRAEGGRELAPQDIPQGSIIAFAHLLDAASASQKVAQDDRLLVDPQNLGNSPLRPGQTVRQGFGLSLPADLAPGTYPLVVGLYHTAGGQRLPRADSPDDFMYLTDIVVQ